MPVEASAWYDAAPDVSALYQGDVIYDVPVVFMPPSGKQWVLLRPNNVPIEQVKKGQIPGAFKPFVESKASNPWSGGTDLVFAKGTKLPVVILTQTCDLDQRKWIQCAPVYLIPGTKTPESIIESYHQFPLPGDKDLDASYVELSQVTSIHESYIKQARLVKRLSGYARAVLQEKLAKFYGRPFAFTMKDQIPQDSEYVCLRCAIDLGVGTRATLVRGSTFPACSNCGEGALWTKVPSYASAQPQEQLSLPGLRIQQPPEADLPVDTEDAQDGTPKK